MEKSLYRKNALIKMKINVMWMTKKQGIREGIANLFQSFLFESMDWRVGIHGLPFASLSEEEASSLEMPFRVEGVHTLR